MTRIRMAALGAPLAWIVVAATAMAGDWGGMPGNGSAHTYFGRYGNPTPYGPPPVNYQHPWTARFFGFRCIVTPEEHYQDLQRQYAIVQAKHEVAINRLNWKAYEDYVNPKPKDLHGYLGRCNCNDGSGCGGKCGYGKGGCGKGGCGHGDMGGDGGCGDGGCGGKLAGLFHKGKNGSWDEGVGRYPVVPPPYAYFPGMNREDATRYLEGFQYQPPYQLLHSPRDFFMFDAKYGVGR